MFFVPLKGSPVNHRAIDFLDSPEIIVDIEKYLGSKPLPDRLKNSEGFRGQLRADYIKFTSEPLNIIPISEIPYLDENYSWKFPSYVIVPEKAKGVYKGSDDRSFDV